MPEDHQLNSNSMDKCRAAAREWVKNYGDPSLRDKLDNSKNASSIGWEDLREDVCFNEGQTSEKVSFISID